MMELPQPLTPIDCDLRGYEFMPLYGQRLFGSRLYSLALRDPRAGLAAVKLWWEAWQQCPAASLPDDDFDLARMADFGGDLKGWKKVRDIALHGFVRCADGRLYHPILAASALDAWERRKRDRVRKAEQRAKRNGQGGDIPPDVPRDKTRTDEGTSEGRPQSVRSDRTGEDRTVKKETSSLPPTPTTKARASASPLPDLPDWMPVRAWSEFVEARRQMKKPITIAGFSRLVSQLSGWHQRGLDVESALDASTAAGWQGVFEPKAPPALRVVQGGASKLAWMREELAARQQPHPTFDLDLTAAIGGNS